MSNIYQNQYKVGQNSTSVFPKEQPKSVVEPAVKRNEDDDDDDLDAGVVAKAVNGASALYSGGSNLMDIINYKVDLGPEQRYSEQYEPIKYEEQATPEEISGGYGEMAGKGLMSGMRTGYSVAGGWGALGGAVIGAAGGLIGAEQAEQKRKNFDIKQDRRKKKYYSALAKFNQFRQKEERDMATQDTFSKRRENNVPLYNSSLYGLT